MLSVLRKERRVSLEELARRIQKETADAKTTVEWLVETGLVEAEGNSRNRGYILSSRVYSGSGNEIGYTRQKGMTINQEISMIERHDYHLPEADLHVVFDGTWKNNDNAYFSNVKKEGFSIWI